MQKPEEIIFDNPKIEQFLKQRGITTSLAKQTVSEELEKLFGFSFKDLHDFRKAVITIAEKQGQIFDILPLNQNDSMKIVFVFKKQLVEEIAEEKLFKILHYLSYKPTYKDSYSYESLNDPHLDYRFVFEYENIIAFGILDSANSMTMFENIAASDHFIEDIFGEKATKVFKKAQQDISYLIGMKIGEHFSVKEGFFVPAQQKGVPNVNFKTVMGNGIKKKIVSRENQDLGDIDAVAVDTSSKTINLFEIKYYKPGTRNEEMLKKDKKIFEDIDKILARARWFEENINDVIKAWGLEEGNYSVQTFLITGRPNYYGKQLEAKHPGLNYSTYDEILRL